MHRFEIPVCSAFMLAERTDEHLELFREGEDAAFFGSPGELVEKVRYHLMHEDERMSIAQSGYRRVREGHDAYRDRLLEIIQRTTEGRSLTPWIP